MNRTEIQALIEKAYRKNKKRFPDHIMAQAGMVGKEAGKIQQLAYEVKYEGTNNNQQMVDATVNTIVAGIRLLENIKGK